MKNFYIKLLRSNRRDYGLVIFVGVVTVVLIYFTTALTACMYQVAEGQPGTGTEVYAELGIFIVTYVLMILLVALVVIDYIRKRIYTYNVLNALGISKTKRTQMIAMEYAGVVMSSVLGGLALGILGTVTIKIVIKKFLLYKNYDYIFQYGTIPLRLTLIICLLIFGVLFLAGDQLIACIGIESLLNMGKNKRQRSGKQKALLIAGMILEILAIGSFLGYWGKVNKIFPVVLGSLGLYFFLQFIWEYKTKKLSKNRRKYYKKLLWMNPVYDKLFHYTNLSFLVAALIFIVLVVPGMAILDNFPPVALENFPYDIVWLANQKDQEFIKSLKDKYACKIETQECIRVTTPDFGEHMGISNFTYNKWTGNAIELGGEEIFIVYQREREQRNELGIDYGRRKPRIFIGNARYDLWIWETPHIMPSIRFDKEYTVSGEENRILTGIFESNAIESTKSKVWEDIIVFSDEYFKKVRNCAEGANLAVMMSVSANHYESLLADIKDYAKIHSQVNFLAMDGSNLVYEKDKLFKENQRQKVIKLTSVTMNAGILLLCVGFIFVIKQRSDYKERSDRYHFYYKLGMQEIRRKKNIYKESYMFTSVSVIVGGIVGSIFTDVLILQKRLPLEEMMQYGLGIISIFIGISIIFFILIWILTYQDVKRIERRNRDA